MSLGLPEDVYETIVNLFMRVYSLRKQEREILAQYPVIRNYLNKWYMYPVFPDAPMLSLGSVFPSGSLAILTKTSENAMYLVNELKTFSSTTSRPYIITYMDNVNHTVRGLSFVRIAGPIYVDIYTTWNSHEFFTLYEWIVYDMSHNNESLENETPVNKYHAGILSLLKSQLHHLAPIVNAHFQKTLWLIIDNRGIDRSRNTDKRIVHGWITPCIHDCSVRGYDTNKNLDETAS